MKTTAGLDSLPNETLALIFSKFCRHCTSDAVPPHISFYEPLKDPLDRRALLCLCLTSRRLRAAAQSFLYHEFVTSHHSWPNAQVSADSWRPTTHWWNWQFVSFLRTVMDRHDLAASVRRILVYAYPRPEWNSTNWTHPWSTISFTAARLPNLRHYSLNLCDMNSYPSSISWCLDEESLARHSRTDQLPSPPDLIRTEDPVDLPADVGVDLASRKATTPSLDTQAIDNTSEVTRQLRVKTLCISAGCLESEDLQRLLSNCTGLRHFIYNANLLFVINGRRSSRYCHDTSTRYVQVALGIPGIF